MKAFVEELAAVHKQMAAGNFQLAAQACTQQLTASASDIPFLALLTAACEHAGEVGKARDAAARWVNMAPLDAYAHYKLGMLEQRLHNYREAVRRLRLAVRVAGPDEDVRFAADDALRALDALQLQQVVALCDVDVCFRMRLKWHPESTLSERGFALSDDAVRQLHEAERWPRWLDNSRSLRPC